MSAQKAADARTARAGGTGPERKTWRKKTPVEVVFEQAEKLKAEIAEIEEDLKAKRVQLQKFEEARKIFEAS